MLKFFMFAAILTYTQAIRCPRIFCLIVSCPNVSACSGVLTKGFCGCCDICPAEQGPCAKEKAELEARFQNPRENGMPPIVPSLPVCTLDGYYAPKQCRGSQCLCVNRNGDKIKSYMENKWEANNMNCQCARDENEHQKTGLVGKVFRCTSNGSYAPIQCTGSVCFCVDQSGNQVGKTTVNISVINTLTC